MTLYDRINTFFSELALTATTASTWIAILQAFLLGAIVVAFGLWFGRRSRILGPEIAPAPRLGVALALGLCALISLWAAVWSGGMSAFTPVAGTFALAFLSTFSRNRTATTVEDATRLSEPGLRTWLPALSGPLLFIGAAALLYGATLAPVERGGVQPLEFLDEGFYSVLGRDLAATGLEWALTPSGFTSLPRQPPQTWYHWGELWLAAAAIRLFGTEALVARHLIALPLVLFATTATTGAFVQAFSRTKSRAAFVFGVATCLVLAPAPLLGEGLNASAAVGLAFGITVYGLAAVAVALLVWLLLITRDQESSWPLALVIGATFATLLAAHIIIFVLAAAGIVVGGLVLGLTSIGRRRSANVPTVWARSTVVAVLASLATLAWGSVTGHGISFTGPSVGVLPFGEAWQQTMLSGLVGAGLLLTVPIVAWVLRVSDPYRAAMCWAAAGIAVIGAVAWGARLADYNTSYAYFGAVAVVLTPVAAATSWWVLRIARRGRVRTAYAALIILVAAQLEFGAMTTLLRLQSFGPGTFKPIPSAMLDAIRSLPPDAKIAYGCQPMLEFAIWDPQLVSIDAHTGRRMVSMCFHADALGHFVGAPFDPTVEGPFFRIAPQRALYPTHDAEPTPESIARFLRSNGIDYLYQDEEHTKLLVPWATEIHRDGDHRLWALP